MILRVAKSRIANIRLTRIRQVICFSCARSGFGFLYRQETGRNREDRISCQLCSFQPEQVKIEKEEKST